MLVLGYFLLLRYYQNCPINHTAPQHTFSIRSSIANLTLCSNVNICDTVVCIYKGKQNDIVFKICNYVARSNKLWASNEVTLSIHGSGALQTSNFSSNSFAVIIPFLFSCRYLKTSKYTTNY